MLREPGSLREASIGSSRSASGRPAVVVEGLRKAYADVQALADVTFTIERGEVFALVGPNGAGKTTAVEILEGHRERNAGMVSVLGLDPANGGTEFRSQIGIVLQAAGLEEELTPYELLEHYATYYPSPRHVEEVLAEIDLADIAGRRVRTLSGGQRRRLDLGLALIGDPEILFLDEPTTGFDPAARRAAWGLIAGLRDRGVTIVLTTHYMEEAQVLADRVAIIVGGRITAEGTPAGLSASQGTQLRFRMPDGIGIDELPEPVRSRGRLEGQYAIASVTEPTRTLQILTAWAIERRCELAELSVRPASLEDVYLRLTAETDDHG